MPMTAKMASATDNGPRTTDAKEVCGEKKYVSNGTLAYGFDIV